MSTAVSLHQHNTSAWTGKGRLKGQHLQPRSTDIFVSGRPKSGSTTLQQIVHQLSTCGDMDFGKLIKVVPVVDFAHDLHLDFKSKQKWFPTLFQDQLLVPPLQKGCQIHVVCSRTMCLHIQLLQHASGLLLPAWRK